MYSGASGKEVLINLIADHKKAYEKLTDEEREQLIRLFEESKSTAATSMRLSPKAKINDVWSTLTCIETEVPTY